MSREYTNRLLEAIDEGWIDETTVLTACLKYMSEDDVKDMCQINEFFEDIEEEDEDQ